MERNTRGDRIIYRQKQCAGCKFDSEVKIKDRLYGFCSKQNKRYCDLNIWEECPYFSEKKKGVMEDVVKPTYGKD